MFFSYYLPRKVVCSKTTIRATGTTGAKLARWLGSKGLVDESAAEDAVDAARHLTRELLDGLANEQETEESWAW